MSKHELTERRHVDPDSAREESLWSRISREANLLNESAAAGVTGTLREVEHNPGKAIMAAGMGVAMSAPLLVLSSRFRVLQPLLNVAGVAGTACFVSDIGSKLGGIGSAAADYWDHSEHKEVAGKKIAGNVGGLFVDSVAAYGGLWAGSRYTKKLFEPVGELGQFYTSKVEKLKATLIPRKEEPEILQIIDEDAYWAHRAKQGEKSGFAGVEKSMEALMKNMPYASKRESELVDSFLTKAKVLVPGTKLRYVERVHEVSEPAIRIGIKLPPGMSMLGDEAFTLDDLAGKLSAAEKYRVSANMTPVAGDGQLVRLKTIAEEDLADDAIVRASKAKRQLSWPFGLGKRQS
jgi:hypothetical protein